MLSMLLLSAALAQDVGAYREVLVRHVDARGRVDYAALNASDALEPYLESLACAREPAGASDRMAFWINAYNALAMDLAADHYPLASLRELDGGNVWETRPFAVAGRSVTLNHIEHHILRPMGDPRIHAELNCASASCPPLSREPFSGANLDQQLNAAARRWLDSGGGARIDEAAGIVELSPIFEWYGDDFLVGRQRDIPGVEGAEEAALNFVAANLPEHAAWIRAGGYTVEYEQYDWRLNRQ